MKAADIPRGAWVLGTLVCVLSAMGCASDEEAPARSIQIVDSAGVRIVESKAPGWSQGSGWSVDFDPVLDLTRTGSGPAHQFDRVADATRLNNGTIVVAERGASELRFFAEDGTLLDRVGGEGQGPGEFERLVTVNRYRGDSLVAFDFGLGRITVLSHSRDVGRTSVIRNNEVRVEDLQPLTGGEFAALFYPRSPPTSDQGRYRMTQTVRSVSANGEVLDSVATIPGHEGFLFEGTDGLPLFGKSAHVATHGNDVYVGSADGLTYEIQPTDGGRVSRIRVPGYDLSLSAAEIRRERQSRLDELPDNAPPFIRRFVERLPGPESRPGYSELIVDATGHIWLEEYRGETAQPGPADWHVFAPEGQWLGTVRLPPRFTVFEIGGDYVLGKRLDELDVEHVQLLRLHRQ